MGAGSKAPWSCCAESFMSSCVIEPHVPRASVHQEWLQHFPELLTGTMQTRSHAGHADVARRADLVVAQAGYFAQQEHVAIERRQALERLLHRDGCFLGRRPRRV